jgi:hypothetical protein
MLADRAIQIEVGLAHQAVPQLSDEDLDLARGGLAHPAARAREAVPGLGEGEEVRPPSAAVGREHWAHPALAVDVRADDDPLVTFDAVEHRLASGNGQAIDGETQLPDGPRAVMTRICHTL